ncbi:MAG: hypothetical protein JWO00_428 [Candidatus Parcubacteria bacterium]|nr:hypothetical protein [Candidatus Parcubacteria bacterium]
MEDNKITYFGETDSRNKRVKFGIKAKDRTRHVYVIGKTGMGKSTLLENLAVQDIQGGDGMCFIDPHGKSADLLLEYVPKDRIRDVIYIAPFDTDHPISFNVLESVDPTKRHLVVGGLMSTFKKIWVDAWSARMEYILTNTLLALLEAPNTTLLGVNRMLSDKAYRNEIITHITDPSVKSFWVKEFANYTERMAAEAVPAIQNKVGQFTANPLIRNMIGQSTSSFDFREAMDKRKILIINLSKGKIGDENMKLLGGLLVTKIYLAAMSRADVPDRVMKMLPNFYLFVDEFQNFANASFADILSEARKYKLNLTIAHQYVEQMDELVRPAVFGNVGTMIVFRVGANDAEMLEKEFAPQFMVEDLVNLGQFQMYLKLMIDGLTSSPFSATNLPPIAHPDTTYVQEIIAASREQFAKSRAAVEEEIVKFHEATVAPKAPAAPKSLPIAPKVAPAAAATASAPIAAAATPAPAPAPKPVPTPVTASAPVPASQPQPRPVAQAPAPVQPIKPAPTPAPQPTHKPFANLKEVFTEVPPKPASAQLPQTPSVPPTAPVQPVSLSALSQKPSPKLDSKVPTQKNVNELKNALAAVLGNKPAPSAAPAEPRPAPAQAPASAPRAASPAPSPSPAQIPFQPEQNKMGEVPEEVLKKVLKVE